jgi:hypothetical protein
LQFRRLGANWPSQQISEAPSCIDPGTADAMAGQSYVRAALQTSRWNFQHVIRHARIGTSETIENVVEWKCGMLATRFAGIEEVAQVL